MKSENKSKIVNALIKSFIYLILSSVIFLGISLVVVFLMVCILNFPITSSIVCIYLLFLVHHIFEEFEYK